MNITVRHCGAVIKGRLLRLEDNGKIRMDGERLDRFDVLIEPMPGTKIEIQNVPAESIEIHNKKCPFKVYIEPADPDENGRWQ